MEGNQKVEIVITVEGLPPEHRERFLRGFSKAYYSGKTEFSPPYEWEMRLATDEERRRLEEAS